MWWTVINKINEMDYGRWNEWDGLCEQNKDGVVAI